MRKKGCVTITIDVEKDVKDKYIEIASESNMTLTESIRNHMISTVRSTK